MKTFLVIFSLFLSSESFQTDSTYGHSLQSHQGQSWVDNSEDPSIQSNSGNPSSNCLDNMEWNGHSCVEQQPASEPECPDGRFWNGENCVTSEKKCQPGLVLHVNECMKERVLDPTEGEPALCPDGSQTDANGFCSKEASVCPSGSQNIDGQCKKTITECPTGTKELNGLCEALHLQEEQQPGLAGQPGNRIYARLPVYSSPVLPVTKTVVIGFVTNVQRFCPSGTFMQANRCVSRARVGCPVGYQLRAGRCVSFVVQGCPINFYFNGRTCVERRVCPRNYIDNGYRCIFQPPRCPSGAYWNGIRCITQVVCDPGWVRRGNTCVYENPCPLGTVMNAAGFCVQEPRECFTRSRLSGALMRTPCPNMQVDSAEDY